MMQRIFRASNTVLSGAVIIGLSGLLSRLLGVYRDRLLATTFGAGPPLDAYYAAFRVPDFMFNLIVLGALSAGFIPLFTERLQKDNSQAWKLSRSVLLILSFALIAGSVVLFILAPWLVRFIAPGFGPELMEQTVGLTRIMLLSPVLLGISAVFGGVLQSFKRFLAYSLAPILYNLGIITGIFAFAPQYGIEGVAWGVILGAGLHLLLQTFVAVKLGWKWSFRDVWDKAGVREILFLMGPRTLSLVIFQLNLLVMTFFASGLGAGSVTIFNFANNLAHVPIGLFGISFAVAVFPLLSEYAVQEKIREFEQAFSKTLLQILFFLLPTLVLIILLDEQIVRLVYGAGEFDWPSTLQTARTLLLLTPGILAHAILPLVARAFYARKNTTQPFIAAFLGLGATIGFAWFFTSGARIFPDDFSGVSALSLAYSIGSLLQVSYLFVLLKEKAVFSKRCYVAVFSASAAMFLVVQFTKIVTGPYLDLLTVKGVLMHFLLPVFTGSLAFLAVMKWSGCPLYREYEGKFLKKIRTAEPEYVPPVGDDAV